MIGVQRKASYMGWSGITFINLLKTLNMPQKVATRLGSPEIFVDMYSE